MKTSIHFYKDDKEETAITSIYDLNNFIPFEKGDTFWFSVDMLYPLTKTKLREKYKEAFVNSLISSHERLEKMNNSKFKIVSVYKSFNYNGNSKSDEENHSLRIEYKCKRVNPIYWKFWKTYKFKQFFKL
jgi:hypothetical protein